MLGRGERQGYSPSEPAAGVAFHGNGVPWEKRWFAFAGGKRHIRYLLSLWFAIVGISFIIYFA